MNRRGRTMATPHSRLVDSLTEKLVSTVTGTQPYDIQFRRLRDSAHTRFKANIDPHPDPHAIKAQFTGLVEKFAVLGRDDIAEPLERILPYVISQDANVEILTLLLALSDRPVETVEFDESKFIVEEVVEKGITWEEIIAEEPLSGDHWREPDYSGSDEEDDWVYETKQFTIPEHPVPEIRKTEESRLNDTPPTLIEEFLQQQYWIRREKCVLLNAEYSPELDFGDQYDDEYYLLTELDAIREVLFMLSGWNCILFTTSKFSIKVNNEYRLDHTSADALKSVLSWFADYGSSIHFCRTFIQTPAKTPTLQAFSAALSTQLQTFNSKIADLQSTYANLKTQTISLIALQNRLRDDLELFHNLKSLTTTSNTSNSLLTNLHDLACQSHAIGSHSLHNFTLKLFLPALESYLRPLHTWMTRGDLNSTTYPEFFITSTLHEKHPVYELSLENTAPRFMLHIVNRVLAAGKTMDFVKRMRSVTSLAEDNFTTSLQRQLDYENSAINPFEQAFETALDAWILEKYEFASSMLREMLGNSSELWTQLDRVHGIYCMLSHHSMNLFTHTLFEKMNSPGEWRDRHILTDDLQEAFSADIPSALLSIRIQRSCSLTAPLKCLETLRVNYKILRPISDILRIQGGIYQQILTVLLQIQRTKYLLDRVSSISQHRERRGLKGDIHIVHAVRLELIWFVNSLLNYLGVVVIQPTLFTMKERLRECQDVEELTYTHVQFASSLQYQCLLNEKLSMIHNSVMDILGLGVSFAEKYLQLRGEALPTKGERKRHLRTGSISDVEEPEVVNQETTTENEFIEFVKHLDDRFLRAVPFIRSGLKGSARAAEFPSLGILAASLEAGVR